LSIGSCVMEACSRVVYAGISGMMPIFR
jgi:hypothetical protein